MKTGQSESNLQSNEKPVSHASVKVQTPVDRKEKPKTKPHDKKTKLSWESWKGIDE